MATPRRVVVLLALALSVWMWLPAGTPVGPSAAGRQERVVVHAPAVRSHIPAPAGRAAHLVGVVMLPLVVAFTIVSASGGRRAARREWWRFDTSRRGPPVVAS